MPSQPNTSSWDLGPAISLLNALTISRSALDPYDAAVIPTTQKEDEILPLTEETLGLGNFGDLWDYLGRPRVVQEISHTVDSEGNNILVAQLDVDRLNKGVRWRDELDGADLEDNVEPAAVDAAASLRTQKRAARRAKAKEKATKIATGKAILSDTGTDAESGNELESLRRSPDRRVIIANILGRPRPQNRDASSPPTSPSPPKAVLRTPIKGSRKAIHPHLDDGPISSPSLWPSSQSKLPSSRIQLEPRDGLSTRARKATLISKLAAHFRLEKRYLRNPGLIEPAFTPLNVSPIGIHVFVDVSNITIGFHDCLKFARSISLDTRIRRVPMSFHNFSLILERGRPAAKRVLVGSDKFPVVQQAKQIGYETNILERVHKAKEPTPRQKKFSRSGGASSGLENTSGSETNTPVPLHSKWVEQAVDEILHLKILESLIDAEKPSTIVLATGDAAEAEYSGGFMRMVERALTKGWTVELVSFKLNTSSAYKRRDFRSTWGAMFKWIELDDYVEFLIDAEEE